MALWFSNFVIYTYYEARDVKGLIKNQRVSKTIEIHRRFVISPTNTC